MVLIIILDSALQQERYRSSIVNSHSNRERAEYIVEAVRTRASVRVKEMSEADGDV
jgi:hypothetical protein